MKGRKMRKRNPHLTCEKFMELVRKNKLELDKTYTFKSQREATAAFKALELETMWKAEWASGQQFFVTTGRTS